MKLLLLLLILAMCSCSNWETEYRKRVTALSFLGSVDSIYLDPDGRMQPVVIISGVKYSVSNPIYEHIRIGDTLYKPSGTMKYYWINNGDSTTFYQQYGESDLRD